MATASTSRSVTTIYDPAVEIRGEGDVGQCLDNNLNRKFNEKLRVSTSSEDAHDISDETENGIQYDQGNHGGYEDEMEEDDDDVIHFNYNVAEARRR